MAMVIVSMECINTFARRTRALIKGMTKSARTLNARKYSECVVLVIQIVKIVNLTLLKKIVLVMNGRKVVIVTLAISKVVLILVRVVL